MPIVTKRIRPHRRLGLSSTPTMQVKRIAGLTAAQGAPIMLASGEVIATQTDDLSHGYCVQAATDAQIMGFLSEDGGSDSSDSSKIAFVPALANMTFKGQLVNTLSSALAVTHHTDVGMTAGLAHLTDGVNYGVDKGYSTSRDCLMVTELIDASGTCGGLVGFVVRAGWRQLDGINIAS